MNGGLIQHFCFLLLGFLSNRMPDDADLDDGCGWNDEDSSVFHSAPEWRH